MLVTDVWVNVGDKLEMLVSQQSWPILSLRNSPIFWNCHHQKSPTQRQHHWKFLKYFSLPTLKIMFSTSAFDMQNHQLPHVDSSLLNLKICARIVIQSIPTNQLRPQLFKTSILVDTGRISMTSGHFWPLHVESFFKANICPQTESQLPSFLRPTWLNLHPDLSRLQPDYPKIRSRTDQPAQNEGKELF